MVKLTEAEVDSLRSARPVEVLAAANTALRRAGIAELKTTVYRVSNQSKANLTDNFEDILLRSKTLSRCPNPSNATMQRYAPLAKRAAASVYRRFRVPLSAFGYDREDMVSLAMVHLVTGIHRYRVGDEDRDQAILVRYVRQRLTETVRKVQRKARQCSADLEKRNFGDVSFFLDTGSFVADSRS